MKEDLKIIGIMGGSGSGKSIVSSMLIGLGGYVIDADELAHNNMKRTGVAYQEIVDYFGEDILDTEREIDRKKLGAIVWNDSSKLNRLMEIAHKYVTEETHTLIKGIRENPADYRFIVIDAPLLIEAGMHRIVDSVWLIDAEKETRLSRIIARDGITEEAALARLANQKETGELRRYADVIIENTKGLDELKEQIINVLHNFIK